MKHKLTVPYHCACGNTIMLEQEGMHFAGRCKVCGMGVSMPRHMIYLLDEPTEIDRLCANLRALIEAAPPEAGEAIDNARDLIDLEYDLDA